MWNVFILCVRALAMADLARRLKSKHTGILHRATCLGRLPLYGLIRIWDEPTGNCVLASARQVQAFILIPTSLHYTDLRLNPVCIACFTFLDVFGGTQCQKECTNYNDIHSFNLW